MPTYEYECTKCGYHFEQFQSMKDKPVQRCPKCRCKVRRLLGTGAGILFKGSGFYETDYRSSGYMEAATKEKTAAEPAPVKGDDKKPAISEKSKKPAKAKTE